MCSVVVTDLSMTARDMINYAERKGWRFVRRGKGSHVIFRHPAYPYVISIPDHGSRELARGIRAVLLKQIDGTWKRKGTS